jgi:molybdopterin converting factor small subunit
VATIILRGALKQMAGGRSEHEAGGGTVGEALGELERAHRPLNGWILDERGVVRRHIKVFVNGDEARDDTPVAPGDRVDVLPAISGG